MSVYVEQPVITANAETTLKTREQLADMFRNEHIELFAMMIEVDGYDEILEYSQDMDNPPQELFFLLPEYSHYRLTIKFKVNTRPLKHLTYHQVVKKGGVPFKSRKETVTDLAQINDDDNPYHSITFPPDDIPGGAFIRGTYPATSSFYEDGKKIFTTNWTIKVIKKGRKPEIGGFPSNPC